MALFVERVVTGLAAGAVYGLLALAVVLVHRASGVVNVAQGQMAAFSALVCWSLTDHGWAFWPAFAATIALSFGGGLLVHLLVVRPAEGGSAAGVAASTVGLLLALDGLAVWIWGAAPRSVARPFSTSTVDVLGADLSTRSLATIAVALGAVILLAALLRGTKAGLGLRAAAVAPAEARLAGVPVSALVTVTWGLSAALGAIAGILAAPAAGLGPSMFQTAVLYALAAAALGGLGSPVAAVVAGFGVGVGTELLGAYVDWVDGQLRLAAVLVAVLAIFLLRPSGLAVRRA
jgi:branched-chain amino acid transport system permease protein